MRLLVTGSAGHLGEALVRTLRNDGRDVVGLDVLPSPYTDIVASVSDRPAVRAALAGADAVLHTATLHKPHVGSHSRQEFLDTNVTGTLVLLEEAVAAGVGSFVFTSTTSAFGRALNPADGEPAAWITEDVVPRPRNVYGATKVAAEDLCELVARDDGLPCLVLRTSRFFPEGDDSDPVRTAYADANAKVNELLYRRVDLSDVVTAHLAALDRAPRLGFGRYVVSATTPFGPRTSPSCTATPPPSSSGSCRPIARSTTGSAGGCSRASTACTSTPARGRTSAGSRGTTSPARWTCCVRG